MRSLKKGYQKTQRLPQQVNKINDIIQGKGKKITFHQAQK